LTPRGSACAPGSTIPDHAFGPEPAHLGHGDHVLNPGLVSGLVDAKLREAAVLVPVTDDGADAQVILTRRAVAMRKHSGQVAFPGGAIDPEDGSAETAAMREAEEEIGLDRRFVEPVGRLPVYLTSTGFRITPVLAVVQAGL
jgi:8-oxo-dGTP pyrophosphatase MutT (NUDIX family)